MGIHKAIFNKIKAKLTKPSFETLRQLVVEEIDSFSVSAKKVKNMITACEKIKEPEIAKQLPDFYSHLLAFAISRSGEISDQNKKHLQNYEKSNYKQLDKIIYFLCDKKNINPNYKAWSFTPLTAAIRRARGALANRLLSMGADPRLNDKSETDPLSLTRSFLAEHNEKLQDAGYQDKNTQALFKERIKNLQSIEQTLTNALQKNPAQKLGNPSSGFSL